MFEPFPVASYSFNCSYSSGSAKAKDLKFLCLRHSLSILIFPSSFTILLGMVLISPSLKHSGQTDFVLSLNPPNSDPRKNIVIDYGDFDQILSFRMTD